jgi:6-phosphogluconolactonase (cycloisomerase 2 family)
MLTRRRFGALLTTTVAGSVAGTFGGCATRSGSSWGQPSVHSPARSPLSLTRQSAVLFSGVGRELTRYEVDVASATLVKRETVSLRSGVQYAWAHPSSRFLYVSSSDSGPGNPGGGEHYLEAFRMAPSTGVLEPHGAPIRLRWRPIHNSVDVVGGYALVAYNNPSGVSVHRIESDGTLGSQVEQREPLDCGIFAHQVRATPSNRTVILVTRGNDANANRPEDPGALKVYRFDQGRLSNQASIQPGGGHGFGPRHLDFHPSRPWVYVSIERQNQLHVYALLEDGGLSSTPLFIADTLSQAGTRAPAPPGGTRMGPQDANPAAVAGPIHVHPSGKFVYVANRGGWSASPAQSAAMYQGLPVVNSTASSIAVFEIDQRTARPTLLETVDARGVHPRTFSIDPSGRVLVAGTLAPVALKTADGIELVPAGLSVFRISSEGRLEFQRRYDVQTGTHGTQWWTGMFPVA